jgi:hypothetical protein
MVTSRPWKRDLRCGATISHEHNSSIRPGHPTFIGKQFFLRGSHIVNAIERKAKLLGFVFGIRYPHNIPGFAFLTAFCSHNGIFVKFLFEEGSNARDDCTAVSCGSIERKGKLPRTDIVRQLMKRVLRN